MSDADWKPFLTPSVKLPAGQPIPQRQELRDLKQDPVKWWLYIQGLAKFQQASLKNQSDPLSYFQIAGIHGLPYTTWPNQKWNSGFIPVRQDDGTFRGFCSHSSILFLPWHRPYLALFETSLRQHVMDVANGIDTHNQDRDKYIKAANEFRMPYWDWARKDALIFPQEALDDQLPFSTNLKFPSSTASVSPTSNPLFKAPFNKDSIFDDTFGGTDVSSDLSTIRYPNLSSSSARTTLLEELQKWYANPNYRGKNAPAPAPPPPGQVERNLTQRVGYILRAYSQFAPMSNNSWGNVDPKTNRTSSMEIWGSLEGIHNSVHNFTGGGGHMSDPATSAFDPIFWLHHTNIDRLFAIWEALHEDATKKETYVTQKPAGWSDITTRGTTRFSQGDPQDADTKLYPFRPDSKNWWTSNLVKRTDTFGYSYPETAGYPVSGAARNDLIASLNAQYPDPSTETNKSRQGIATAGATFLPQAHVLRVTQDENIPATATKALQLESEMPDAQTLLEKSLEPSKPLLKDLAPAGKYLEWLVNIKAEKHALGGKYSVHIFLGPVEDDNISLWPISPNHVGTFFPFGQTPETQCHKCRDNQRDRMQITDQIPLTSALMERYLAQIIPDIAPNTVIPYLTENLHWRVEVNGDVVNDQSQLDGLTVFVVSNEVTLPDELSQLATYAPEVTAYPEITTNRNGSGRGNGTGLIASEQ